MRHFQSALEDFEDFWFLLNEGFYLEKHHFVHVCINKTKQGDYMDKKRWVLSPKMPKKSMFSGKNVVIECPLFWNFMIDPEKDKIWIQLENGLIVHSVRKNI